jgi:hypothetical protein
MVNRTVSILTLLGTVALATACSSERQSTVLIPTTPSAIPARTSTTTNTNAPFSLLGTWTSETTVGSRITLPGSLSLCRNLQLSVSSQTATQAQGRLTMDCPNGVTISGNVTGQLGGATIPVVYTGAATTSSESCPFTMNGTFFPMDATTFRFEYTGTAQCVGAIYGTEILRLGNPNPPPSTSPSPTPSAAADMMPLSSAIIHNSPLNVASWPITSALRVVEIRSNGVHVEFSKQDGPGRWPDFTPPGWDGPLQYSLGMVMSINGQYHASAPIEFWHGLPASGGPPSQYATNWFYDPGRWAPMTYHQPAVGETIGFFVCAGDCRNRTDGSGSPVKERTNVVTVTMPNDNGARFVF